MHTHYFPVLIFICCHTYITYIFQLPVRLLLFYYYNIPCVSTLVATFSQLLCDFSTILLINWGEADLMGQGRRARGGLAPRA